MSASGRLSSWSSSTGTLNLSTVCGDRCIRVHWNANGTSDWILLKSREHYALKLEPSNNMNMDTSRSDCHDRRCRLVRLLVFRYLSKSFIHFFPVVIRPQFLLATSVQGDVQLQAGWVIVWPTQGSGRPLGLLYLAHLYFLFSL